MDLKELNDKFKDLQLEEQIKLEDIPDIDLYMDQVTQLFENKFINSKRNQDDKALTKTMVNNYTKGKLLMPVKNKKYSKEHLILMSIIYNLKGALSINDIKSSLNKIVQTIGSGEDYPLREIYKHYLEQYQNDILDAEVSIDKKLQGIQEKMSNSDSNLGEFEENFLLLSSFVNMSNLYRRMSEKLIDDYFNNI